MTYKDLASSYNNGRCSIGSFFKVMTLVQVAYRDCLSLGVGAPMAFPYYGEELAMNKFLPERGIYHNKGIDKFLHKVTIQSNASIPTSVVILDYISYVPFLDLSLSYEQMIQPFVLPRNSDGKMVQAMLVCTGISVGSGTCTLKYINEDGLISIETTNIYASAVGNLVTAPDGASAGVFMQLARNGRGIRQIISVTFSPNLTGIVSLVLVRSLTSISVFESTAPAEIDYFVEGGILPNISGDACLGYVGIGGGAGSTYMGNLEFIW